MHSRRAYLRQTMKQARLQKRLAVAATLAAAGCALVLLQQDAHPEQRRAAALTPAVQAAPAPLRVAAQAAPAPARHVYPYSIVPGGVTSRTELARAVLADKTVAAHYAGFDTDKAELRTVPKARAVYVSYRKGDQVYWTAKKVMLAEGEAVLSDGRSDIRARCGNRISDTPQLPVEVKGPSEQELDTPVEQAQAAGDGALREIAFDPDEDGGEGQSFVAQSFANGAGLLTAAQAQARFDQAGVAGGGAGYLDSLADTGRRNTMLAMLANSASGLGGRTPNGGNGGAANGGAGNTSGGSTSGGGIATGGLGSHNTGDTAPAGSDGESAGSGGGGGGTGGSGGKPAAPPPGPDPVTDPRPDPGSNPLPGRDNPPKDHPLPEPGSLWLSGMAGAALFLQRRLHRRSR
ncbi:hypothetical protein AB4Z32_05890 [Massilia sp. 2TAF26]|uniref:hypothetical protein n=1 Tax=Massilia sp. 2TAF26 TaxID=3233012 RepID=UPI003F9964D5